jgi:hypothetical protein
MAVVNPRVPMMLSLQGAAKKPVQLVLERAFVGLPALAAFIGLRAAVRARKLNIKSAHVNCDGNRRGRQIFPLSIRITITVRG